MERNHKEKPVTSIQRQIDAHGFEDFLTAAAIEVKLLEPGTPDRLIIEFLLKNAVGAENAKSWKEVSRHLVKNGVPMSKNKFQNKLLQRSRRNPFYIGSGYRGYFLIASHADVAEARRFYQPRICQEVANLEALDFLAEKAGFYFKVGTNPDDTGNHSRAK